MVPITSTCISIYRNDIGKFKRECLKTNNEILVQLSIDFYNNKKFYLKTIHQSIDFHVN